MIRASVCHTRSPGQSLITDPDGACDFETVTTQSGKRELPTVMEDLPLLRGPHSDKDTAKPPRASLKLPLK